MSFESEIAAVQPEVIKSWFDDRGREWEWIRFPRDGGECVRPADSWKKIIPGGDWSMRSSLPVTLRITTEDGEVLWERDRDA